jgi:hypothetical protein
MTRYQFYAAVLAGTLASGAVALAAPPVPPTPAETRAETACYDQGIRPNTPEWELCLSHVTRAYDWGKADYAAKLARGAGDARQACLASGLTPGSLGYRTCVEVEVDARTQPQILILGDDKSAKNLAQIQ